MPLPYQTIYARLKSALAEAANVSPERIKAKMPLKGPPLRFTPTGLRALAELLNEVFASPPLKRPITRDQTAMAETVQSLAELVWEAYQ